MYRAGRFAWGLVAVAAATAVGVTTHDAGFVVITFLGSLWLPRVLGLAPRRGPGFGWRGMSGGGCSGHRHADPAASAPAAQSL